MQVSGGGITSQGPLRFPCSLPSRQSECELKESGESPHIERLTTDGLSLVNGLIGGRQRLLIRSQQWKPNEFGPLEPSKRVRLICPVQIPQCPGVAIEMMLGLEMVMDDSVNWILIA